MANWKNLGDLINRMGDLERPAVIDLRDAGAPRTWSHLELDRLANGVAHYLVSCGFVRGRRVAILSANRAEYLAAYFGIMRAGLVAVPVNTKLARETIDFIIDDAEIAYTFVDRLGNSLIADRIPRLDFDDLGRAGFAASVIPGMFKTVEAGPQEIGQMLYTSGSTGRPKGVPLSHAGQLWALTIRSGGQINEADRYLIAQPLFHMNGLFSAKTVFATNASVVMLPSFESRHYLKALAEYKITTLMAVPTMFARIIKEADLLASLDFSSLHRIGLGSAPITLGLLERIQKAFPEAMITLGYGTTEAGPAVFGPHPDGLPTPPLALGYPIAGCEVKLMNGPDEDEGELLMRNPAVMSGYHNLPQQTSRVLAAGWYSSGDLMRRDENGFYYFVGRADDMFVCSGENIYPTEVEKMLERHPLVQQAVVVPLQDEERGQIPVAFIVSKTDAQVTVDEIRQFALAIGPAYQHPRRIKFMRELPWAGTNKIDRTALIELARTLDAAHAWSQ